MDRIERRIVLPAPPERIWLALTGPREISRWFGAEVEFEPRPGRRARFRWDDGRERGAVVESVEFPSRLCFRWMPFERDPDQKVRPAPPGRVEFVLRKRRGGTELTVTEWVHIPGTVSHRAGWVRATGPLMPPTDPVPRGISLGTRTSA